MQALLFFKGMLFCYLANISITFGFLLMGKRDEQNKQWSPLACAVTSNLLTAKAVNWCKFSVFKEFC